MVRAEETPPQRGFPRREEVTCSGYRILTTHVGSLARPEASFPLLRLKERGQPYDTETFARLVREAVADVVRKQVEAGIDIVTDGEQARKASLGISTIASTASSCSQSRRGQGATHGRAENIWRFPTTTPGLSVSQRARAVAVATARCLCLYGTHQLQGPRGECRPTLPPEDGAAWFTTCRSLSAGHCSSYIAATLPNAYLSERRRV